MASTATDDMADTGGQAKKEKFSHSLSLLSWGLNEEDLVESFLERAFELLGSVADDYEIVFVNDCSTDRTREILESYASKEPRLRVIHNERNLNVGLSCRRAVAAARKDYLFWQTVDWSYDLKNLPIFLKLLDKFDVVQGIRPTPIRMLSYIPVVKSIYRVQSRSDNLRKAVVSLGNYYLLRILFGIPLHDFQNVTIYPTQFAQSFEIRGRTSFVNPEFLIRASFAGARIIEVPIPFIPRSVGQAKGTQWRTIIRSVIDIFRNWILWGWKLRFGSSSTSRMAISRVADPFQLDEDVLRTVTPLFKEFR